MNVVIISGRLAKDPEIRENGETKLARYTLAVRRSFKGAQNTDWLNCVAFGRLADNAEKFLKKGMLINVTGRIQTSTYTNREGQKVYSTDIIVAEQEFAESKKDYEARAAAQDASQEEESSAPAEKPKKKDDGFVDIGTSDFDNDEVPFA